MATHSSIPAWRIPWTEEPGRLLSVESQESDTTWRLNYYYYYYLIHPPTGRDVCTLTGKSVARHSVCCKSRYIADNCFSIVLIINHIFKNLYNQNISLSQHHKSPLIKASIFWPLMRNSPFYNGITRALLYR